MGSKEKTLEDVAREIAEKVADEFMKSILSRLVTETIGLRADFDELKQSMTKVWKSIDRLTERLEELTQRVNELAEAQKKTEARLEELTQRVNELAEAQKKTEARLEELTQRVNELAEAQKKTEARLEELTQRVNELAEAQKKTEARLEELTQRVNELAEAQKKTETRLNSLIGEVANIRGDLVETKVVMDLNMFLSRRGFDVFHHFPNVPYVDVVVESDGFVAAIEVCRKCDVRDVEQVIRGAKVLKEKEGIDPDVLVVFSYTGEVDDRAIKEAEKSGVIIESSTRRLVRKLLELSKMKNR
ncbi:MAG: hypothetical protein ACP6IP_02130 [Candidatus Njordarchaeia archaeon]